MGVLLHVVQKEKCWKYVSETSPASYNINVVGAGGDLNHKPTAMRSWHIERDQITYSPMQMLTVLTTINPKKPALGSQLWSILTFQNLCLTSTMHG